MKTQIFRKHCRLMRYYVLKEEGIAIGSSVVEAANKTLVTQRMKRSGTLLADPLA